jgi:integrase/recombinase XerD
MAAPAKTGPDPSSVPGILSPRKITVKGAHARASTEAKRKALEAAYPGIVTSDLPEWNQDPGLLDWLTSL